jgi:hypothetical protein
MVPAPPVNVPPAWVKPVDPIVIEMEEEGLITAEYPLVTVMLFTLIALSSVQLVLPPASNVAVSFKAGVAVLEGPPLVVDQLLFKEKFPPVGPIQ